MNDLAKAIAKSIFKDDSELDARVAKGIEDNRKGNGEIELVGADGKPVERARVKLRLLKHEFHFGCNGFMHKQFENAEKDAIHDEAFCKLFNLAVIPFYWRDLEPEPGKLRFAKDSPRVYRRPAPDLLLEFCEANGITPKGHPLVWRNLQPDWLPFDKPSLAVCMEKRIAEIAARYGERVKIWDVCNEAIGMDVFDLDSRLPDNHVELAFELASRLLPKSSVLTYNDYMCWDADNDYRAFYMLGRHLKSLNVNFGALGFQYHMFCPKLEDMRSWADGMLNPRQLLKCLDQCGKLGVPLNISEITITAREDLGDGLAFQKEVSERLYRLWFSHPSVNGIIWWNLVDGTAFVNPKCPSWNENMYKGGLLDASLKPKPAYDALLKLVKSEWTSSPVVDYANGAANKFRGFYGDYEAAIETESGSFTRSFKLSASSLNKFKLLL